MFFCLLFAVFVECNGFCMLSDETDSSEESLKATELFDL